MFHRRYISNFFHILAELSPYTFLRLFLPSIIVYLIQAPFTYSYHNKTGEHEQGRNKEYSCSNPYHTPLTICNSGYLRGELEVLSLLFESKITPA